MFLVDTNVVSELRRPRLADRAHLEWANSVHADELYMSVVTAMELEVGVLRIERRDARQGAILRTWLESLLRNFDGRILDVDMRTALRCAALHVPNARPDRDALIAATAMTHGLTIATRNIGDFAPTGVAFINPWAPRP